MGLITGLLTLPVSGPIRGLQLILEQIREQALAEMPSEEQIETLMIEASLQHQAGEISDEEYEQIETQLLEQLNALRTLNPPEHYEDVLPPEYEEDKSEP